MAGRVAGKKALITGAAQGLGAAQAMMLAREGAQVLLADINAAGAAQQAEAINAELGAGTAFSVALDVTSEEQWLAAVDYAADTLGAWGGSSWHFFFLGAQLGRVFIGIQPAFGYEGDPMRLLFERGFATYSEEAKAELLGIDPILITRHGAVSDEVAIAMAKGALENSRAHVAVAITGFAGPGGKRDEEGLVHIAAASREGGLIQRECHFGPRGRQEVRLLAVRGALELLGEIISGETKPQSIAGDVHG